VPKNICLIAISAFILALEPTFASEKDGALWVGSFDPVIDQSRYQEDSTLLAAEYRLKNKQYEKAIELLERYLKSNPEAKDHKLALRDAHLRFGDALLKKEDIAGATREYEYALKVDENCQTAKEKLKSLSK
jgi:tetratricopeptide (TPR) repeat protein